MQIVKVNLVQSLGNSVFQNVGLIAILVILVMDWSEGKVLENDKVVALVSMIYLIFFSLNTLVYFALTNVQNFLGVLFRLSQVFELEEHEMKRITNEKEPVCEVKDGSFSWGFKVKEDQSFAKKSNQRSIIDVQEFNKPIVSELNFSLKSGDLMVVVG
jgi:hypothetical protein